jgi:hypothetical protein
MCPVAAPQFPGEEMLPGWLEHLAGLSDTDAIVYLLTMHKLCENKARGELREMLTLDAAAIVHVLKRLAPETFADALALYLDRSPSGGVARPGMEPGLSRSPGSGGAPQRPADC